MSGDHVAEFEQAFVELQLLIEPDGEMFVADQPAPCAGW